MSYEFAREIQARSEKWKSAKSIRPLAQTPAGKEFAEFKTDAIGRIHDLIGMKMWTGSWPISFRQAGIVQVDQAVYLKTPDDVIPKGCREISNLTYSKATKRSCQSSKR